MIENPEKTMELYHSQKAGQKKSSSEFNSEIYLKMMKEIEKAVTDIRNRYIRQYGKLQITPEPSIFDIAESED